MQKDILFLDRPCIDCHYLKWINFWADYILWMLCILSGNVSRNENGFQKYGVSEIKLVRKTGNSSSSNLNWCKNNPLRVVEFFLFI